MVRWRDCGRGGGGWSRGRLRGNGGLYLGQGTIPWFYLASLALVFVPSILYPFSLTSFHRSPLHF